MKSTSSAAPHPRLAPSASTTCLRRRSPRPRSSFSPIRKSRSTSATSASSKTSCAPNSTTSARPSVSSSASANARSDPPTAAPSVTNERLPLYQRPTNCYDSPVPRQGFPMPNNGTAAQVASEKKLYRIGELSRLADLKPFVLRYWETEFPMLQPVKSSSGHRLYRQEDVAIA